MSVCPYGFASVGLHMPTCLSCVIDTTTRAYTAEQQDRPTCPLLLVEFHVCGNESRRFSLERSTNAEQMPHMHRHTFANRPSTVAGTQTPEYVHVRVVYVNLLLWFIISCILMMIIRCGVVSAAPNRRRVSIYAA